MAQAVSTRASTSKILTQYSSTTLKEIDLKGDTRTVIPIRLVTPPAAHAHNGSEATASMTVQADSGIESAESMGSANEETQTKRRERRVI